MGDRCVAQVTEIKMFPKMSCTMKSLQVSGLVRCKSKPHTTRNYNILYTKRELLICFQNIAQQLWFSAIAARVAFSNTPSKFSIFKAEHSMYLTALILFLNQCPRFSDTHLTPLCLRSDLVPVNMIILLGANVLLVLKCTFNRNAVVLMLF